jgi:hypothetical protein
MPKRTFNKRQETPSTEESISLILVDIKTQQQAWREFLTSLSTEQATEPADGSWSAIDTLIHITAWVENGLQVAHLQARPDEPDPGPTRGPAGHPHINVDRFNADVFSAHQGWTREQALEWSDQVGNELLTALTGLPPERLLGGAGCHGARMWYWMPAFIHSRGHRRPVMRQLLGEVD